MKKIICILLVLTMAFAFSSCGKDKKEFDIEKAKEALLKCEEFNTCALVKAEDIELQYDITLEDTESFYLAENTSDTLANFFVLAKAKTGHENLMEKELNVLIKKYENSWTELNYYPEETKKVNNSYKSFEDGLFIYIISSDNDKCLELIGK